jgi:transcription elongation GreA/GreB family factor
MMRFPALEETMAVQYPSGRDASGTLPRVPMTPEVFRRLQAEVERLAEARTAAQFAAREDGISGEASAPTVLAAGELHLLERRLETLQRVLVEAHVVAPDGMAIVGTRVLLCDADGSLESYELVAPGEADARSGKVSPESPLGSAVLARREGETTQVAAPDGARWVTVVRVD